MSKTLAEYLLLATSQYQNSPKALEWLSIPIQICDDIEACSSSMQDAFDIDKAVGVQLDILGEIIGQNRTLPFNPTEGGESKLDDEDYRKILKLRTYTNYWDGSFANLYEAWNAIFSDVSLLIVDNQDMTATVSITGELPQIIIDMIYADLILPRPEAVAYLYEGTIPDTAALFAYDYEEGESPYLEGYNIGYWDKKM